MRIRFRPAALVDLDKIYDSTVERWSLKQADNYHAQLMAAVDRLLANPRSGHVYASLDSNIKYRSISSGRHLVFYQIDGEIIDIIRILHDRMDLRSKLADDDADTLQ